MQFLFESERLLFRKFTLADAYLIYDLNNDPEVVKYVHELPTTRESAEVVMRDVILPQYEQNNYGRWALHLMENNEFIGWCGLKYRIELNVIDLGYRLKRMFWNKGYATEAARRTVQYAREPLRLDKITAYAHIENTASCKVLEKCGMRFIGTTEIDETPVKSYELILNQERK